MQKIFDGGDFGTARYIHITPRLLRKLADRLEEISKDLGPHEAATIELTQDIVGYYEPYLDSSAPVIREQVVK